MAQNGHSSGIEYWLKEEISLTHAALLFLVMAGLGAAVEWATAPYLVPEYLPEAWSVVMVTLFAGILFGWTWRRQSEE